MGKKPEVRMSEGTAAFLAIAVILVIVGAFTNWYGFGAETTVSPSVPSVDTKTTVPLQLIPAIEKTKIYVSTYDQADFDNDKQKNRLAGTGELIKSGVSIDTVTTLTTGAAASSAEFNGGDLVILFGDANDYYKKASKAIEISETLQPLEVFLRAQGTPSVYLENDKGDSVTTMALAANEVSKKHSIVIERPGDKTWYQFCGIAAEYNDKVLEPRLKIDGKYETGLTVLTKDYDFLKAEGFNAVWAFDEPLMNFDELAIDFLVGTEEDVLPVAEIIVFQVFDCEENLQNGVIVYTNEDSANNAVGLAGINLNLTVN